MEWIDGKARGLDRSSSLTFALPQPRHVLAIRLRYRFENVTPELTPAGVVVPVRGHFWWWNTLEHEEPAGEPASFTLVPSHPYTEAPGQTQTCWIWINDTMDRLRIQPSPNPFFLRVAEVAVLEAK